MKIIKIYYVIVYLILSSCQRNPCKKGIHKVPSSIRQFFCCSNGVQRFSSRNSINRSSRPFYNNSFKTHTKLTNQNYRYPYGIKSGFKNPPWSFINFMKQQRLNLYNQNFQKTFRNGSSYKCFDERHPFISNRLKNISYFIKFFVLKGFIGANLLKLGVEFLSLIKGKFFSSRMEKDNNAIMVGDSKVCYSPLLSYLFAGVDTFYFLAKLQRFFSNEVHELFDVADLNKEALVENITKKMSYDKKNLLFIGLHGTNGSNHKLFLGPKNFIFSRYFFEELGIEIDKKNIKNFECFIHSCHANDIDFPKDIQAKIITLSWKPVLYLVPSALFFKFVPEYKMNVDYYLINYLLVHPKYYFSPRIFMNGKNHFLDDYLEDMKGKKLSGEQRIFLKNTIGKFVFKFRLNRVLYQIENDKKISFFNYGLAWSIAGLNSGILQLEERTYPLEIPLCAPIDYGAMGI